jgi:putative tricarboxylic transport membrane protein
MKEKDRISSIFWLIISVLILKETWVLPFGTLSRPRPGFFPLIIGMVLGLLSLILLVKSWLGKKESGEDFRFFSERGGWKRIGLTLGTMLVFYLFLKSAGFLLATFFLVLVLIRFVEPHKWLYSVGIAALISLCSYLLFQVLLKSDLPMGILEGLGF